jgi:hypothetical protein
MEDRTKRRAERAYREAREQIELTREQLVELYDLYMNLADEHSACPFCPRARARRATLNRIVYVRGNGEEKPYRDNVELSKDLGQMLFGDLLLSAESKWTLSSIGSILPAEKWILVKAYRCAEHGEFLYVLDDGPVGWWSGAAPRLLVRRGQTLQRANLRFMICPAVIERVGPDGTTQGFEPCFRVAEWNGCSAGVGPCSWTCSRHGTWGVREDGIEIELENKIERRFCAGTPPRHATT